MTLGQFWKTILKHWLLILACVVIVGAGAYLKGKTTAPTYQASALVQVSVGSGSTNLDDLLASSQLVQTEVVLATTGPVLRAVAARHPGIKAEELASEVTVAAKTNAFVFEIDVQSSTPTLAAALANDIAQELINQQTSLQKRSVRNDKLPPAQFLFLAQPAQPPKGYILPNPRLNVELGLVAGLLLGIVLALLFELIDPRIRTVKALQQEIPWPMLSVLHRIKGMKHLIDVDGQGAHMEAYNQLAARMALLSIRNQTRFLLVASPTEHDGKTTVAANLAVRMARSGKKTLLIDANLRDPGLYERFDLPVEKAGLTNALLAFAQSAALARSSAQPSASDLSHAARASFDVSLHSVGVPNLQVMPSGPLPPNPSELLSSTAMDFLCEALKKSDADIIIFDAPSLLDVSDTQTLLTKADSLLLVIDMMRADKRDLAEVKTLLTSIDVHVLGYVANKLRQRIGMSRQERGNGSRRSVYNAVKKAEPSISAASTNSRNEEPVKAN